MGKFPQAVKACLWSYDTDKMKISSPEDRFRIVLNILNRGTMEAVEWLLKTYSAEEIAGVIRKSIASEWNRKSLAFWSYVYEAKPERETRFA